MNNETANNFLKDLCEIIRDKALRAKKHRDDCHSAEDRNFANGQLMTYHEIVSLIQSQALSYDIDASELKMQGIDPDIDLL